MPGSTCEVIKISPSLTGVLEWSLTVTGGEHIASPAG